MLIAYDLDLEFASRKSVSFRYCEVDLSSSEFVFHFQDSIFTRIDSSWVYSKY